MYQLITRPLIVATLSKLRLNFIPIVISITYIYVSEQSYCVRKIDLILTIVIELERLNEIDTCI